jgi:hypothetical protein
VKAADQWAQGWPANPTMQPLMGWLRGDTLQEVVEGNQPLTGWLRGDTLQEAVKGNPKLKVGGGRTPRSAGHVARPAPLGVLPT